MPESDESLVAREWVELLDQDRAFIAPRAKDIQLMVRTPSALVDVGFPDLPWYADAAHVIREAASSSEGGHGIGWGELPNLPALLADPLGVFSEGKPGRVTILLDAVDDENLPVIAVAAPNAWARHAGWQVPCNYLITVYGRSNLVDLLYAVMKCDRVIAFSEQRAAALICSCFGSSPAFLRYIRPSGKVEVPEGPSF